MAISENQNQIHHRRSHPFVRDSLALRWWYLFTWTLIVTNKGLPWFPLYADDWLSSGKVNQLNLAQQGMYLRLLVHQWRLGKLPKKTSSLRQLSGAANAIHGKQLPFVIELCFEDHPDDPDSIINKRLEVIRAEQVKKREANVRKTEKARKAARSPSITDDVTDPVTGIVTDDVT